MQTHIKTFHYKKIKENKKLILNVQKKHNKLNKKIYKTPPPEILDNKIFKLSLKQKISI